MIPDRSRSTTPLQALNLLNSRFLIQQSTFFAERVKRDAGASATDRPLDYATAPDGSGQWLYAIDVEHRIPHRVSSGISEQYMSVAVSSTQPRRLITSVANPSMSLWSVPVSERVEPDAAVTRFPVPNTRALGPRFGSDYVLFLSSRGGADGVWKLEDGSATELWKGSDGGLLAPPAISADGKQFCFSYRSQGRSGL